MSVDFDSLLPKATPQKDVHKLFYDPDCEICSAIRHPENFRTTKIVHAIPNTTHPNWKNALPDPVKVDDMVGLLTAGPLTMMTKELRDREWPSVASLIKKVVVVTDTPADVQLVLTANHDEYPIKVTQSSPTTWEHTFAGHGLPASNTSFCTKYFTVRTNPGAGYKIFVDTVYINDRELEKFLLFGDATRAQMSSEAMFFTGGNITTDDHMRSLGHDFQNTVVIRNHWFESHRCFLTVSVKSDESTLEWLYEQVMATGWAVCEVKICRFFFCEEGDRRPYSIYFIPTNKWDDLRSIVEDAPTNCHITGTDYPRHETMREGYESAIQKAISVLDRVGMSYTSNETAE